MKNIVDKKDKKDVILLDFQISSQNNHGASTEYSISEDGGIRLNVAYGYMIPDGPTRLVVEDHLSDEELLSVRRFIHSEMAEEEYESISTKGMECVLRSPERIFIDCPKLTEKFMQLLNQIALGHPIISRDSIIPVCRAMEAQAAKKMKNYNHYEKPFTDEKANATYDSFNNHK